MDTTWHTLNELIQRGGWVMWPLAAMSVIALTLIFERCWYWLRTNNPAARQRCDRLARHLRAGKRTDALTLTTTDNSVYGSLVGRLLDEPAITDAVAFDAIESQRHRLERFMPTLGTIITAAPMLGILGTVTGIISAFNVLSDEAVTDPSKVAGGIAEALLTTVVGLIIAIVVLFPYNAFRVQIDRTMTRLETLAAAAQAGVQTTEPS